MSEQVPVVEAKAKVKFGFKQLKHKTPEVATWIFRFILYAAAVVNIIVDTFPEIPFEVKGYLAIYSVKAVALVHALTKLFGLEVQEPVTTELTQEAEDHLKSKQNEI